MANKLERKDINLLPLITKKRELTAQNKRARGMLVILALVVLAYAGLFAAYMVQMNDTEAAKQEVETYLTSDDVVAAYSSALELRDTTLQAQNQSVALSSLFNHIESQATLSSEEFNSIEELCGSSLVIDRIEADMQNKTLHLTLRGQKPEDISPFVANLRQNDVVSNVVYNGYASQNAAFYYFSVSCSLKEVGASE